MHKNLSLLSFIFFISASTLIASNYYWVGGTGTWSDYATHWATSSGGTVFHVTIPSPLDDVFFDANSFPTIGDTVYLDTTITNCKTMDWSAVTNSPVVKSQSAHLDLYGSLILGPSMTWGLQGILSLKSASTGNILNPAGTSFLNSSINFMGTGDWDIMGAISCGQVSISSGIVRTNGYPINCGQFSVSGSSSLDLDTSTVNCSMWMTNSLALQLDADSSTINCLVNFWGGMHYTYYNVSCIDISSTDSCTFNDVSCSTISGSRSNFHNVVFPNSCTIYGLENVFNKITIPASYASLKSLVCDSMILNNPGQTVEMNDTVRINRYIQADGNCNGLTSINSGVLYKPSGNVTMSYVLLQNISATGGATFTANNSVDAGGVTGFTINAPAAQSLYWVGGTGNWNDVNHWATTSGGVGGSCVPSQFDNIFFDANSFPTSNDTVYTNVQNVYCKTMDWSTATNSPVLKGSGTHLDIHGSLILSPSMTWGLQGVVSLKSSAFGNIINPAGTSFLSSSINFSGTGDWDIMGAISCGQISISIGIVRTNGYPINCAQFSVSGSSTLNLDTSTVNCSTWMANSLALHLDADSSTINCLMYFWGGMHYTYYNVSCVDINSTDSCTFNDVSCSTISGSRSNFHNVVFPNSCTIYGIDNVFNKITIPCSYASLQSLICDSLILNNPGQTVLMNGTVRINSYIQADGNCSGLTSISTGVLYKSSGNVTLNYVLLQNISATGGATFTANNSVDAGGVTGFTINAPGAQSLFWVGGTGNWNDVNHWATTSGGIGGSCVPSQFDNIFFDANSFPTSNDTVYTNVQNVYCKTMDWSTATNSPVLKGSGTHLDVHGSLILSPSMTWGLQGVVSLKSASAGNILNPAGTSFLSSSINFSGTGDWDLIGAISCGQVSISSGTVRTNGNPINCGQFSISGSSSLDLDTSTVNCSSWMANSIALQLDADSSTINCLMYFWGGMHYTYYNVSCIDINSTDSCTFNDVSCSTISGSRSSFHNVVFPNSCSINGIDNVFNKITVPASNGSLLALTCDSLILNNPGQTISFSDTIFINNFFLIQSDPGFPTTLQCNFGTATISQTTDTVCADYLYLKNIHATGGALFFAGDHSVDLGGNSGWNWIRCAPLISNVWPGDCNYDLVTDNFDLLNIGVAYGDTGYVRPGASLTYIAQPCQDWYYQFINAVNVKHADCDGNGIVDGPDSTAISLNYGITHPARLIKPDETNSVGAELSFVIPPAIVPGTMLSVPITLGTSVDPADNVYGIAFTVNYDPAFIQSGTMSVDYSGSWVENSSNHLHIEKDFPGAGKIDIAFTRIDHADVTGYGMIATLNFVVLPNVDGPFNLSFSHVRVISHNEIEVPVQTNSGNTYVGIEENSNSISSVVYPNPMTNQTQIFFSNPSHEKWTLTLKDVTGRMITSEKTTTENIFLVERKNLGNGIYFYSIRNSEGKSSEGKIILN